MESTKRGNNKSVVARYASGKHNSWECGAGYIGSKTKESQHLDVKGKVD